MSALCHRNKFPCLSKIAFKNYKCSYNCQITDKSQITFHLPISLRKQTFSHKLNSILHWWRCSAEIRVVSLIGCRSDLNFRAQIVANQRHETDLCRTTCIHTFIIEFPLRGFLKTITYVISVAFLARKEACVCAEIFLHKLRSVVIWNFGITWFADVWRTHPMQMSVSWYMVYPCLPTVWF